MRARVIKERDFVIVVAERVLRAIRHQQRYLLAAALLLGVPFDVVSLGGEADAERRIRTRGDGRENVDGGRELDRQRRADPS